MEIKMKRILCVAAAIAISTAAFMPIQASAQPGVNVIIGAPPPLRYERIPDARRGYVWVNGYWRWNGHRHLWMRGHWVRERHGHYYRHPEWREGGGSWRFDRGGWERGHR
jgi:hypothetical protein